MPSSRMRSSTASRTLLSESARGSTPDGVVRKVVQQPQRARDSPEVSLRKTTFFGGESADHSVVDVLARCQLAADRARDFLGAATDGYGIDVGRDDLHGLRAPGVSWEKLPPSTQALTFVVKSLYAARTSCRFRRVVSYFGIGIGPRSERIATDGRRIHRRRSRAGRYPKQR